MIRHELVNANWKEEFKFETSSEKGKIITFFEFPISVCILEEIELLSISNSAGAIPV